MMKYIRIYIYMYLYFPHGALSSFSQLAANCPLTILAGDILKAGGSRFPRVTAPEELHEE